MIRKNLLEVNSKDYPKSAIQFLIKIHSPKQLIEKSKEKNIYVLVEKDKIIGTVSLKGDWVLTVFVNPDVHGRGLGRKLMEYIENVAKKRKITKLTLPSSITAEKFYKKLGYKKIERKKHKECGVVILMTKRI